MREFTRQRRVPILLMVAGVLALAASVWVSPNLTRAEGQQSLYDRLGGKEAITAVVDEFVNRTVADSRVNFRFASTDAKKFKASNVELICEATGGPCQYQGKDMKTAHAGMRISNAEFDILAGHLAATLKKFKVPRRERQELLGIIGSLRKDIVEAS